MNQEEFNQQLCEFLQVATTPFHAVAEMIRQLQDAKFTPLAEGDAWKITPGGKYYLQRNDSSIIAFTVPQQQPISATGLRMVGAHTDSPCLMVKPNPEIERHGFLQMGVQVYGGALLNPWFDRDLSLAGKLSYADSAGVLRTALVDFRRAIAVIPSLAIHLDRDANKKRKINAQKDIPPILAQLGEGEKGDVKALLRDQLQQEHPQIDCADVLDFELCFYDTQAPSLIGLNSEFIASARLDNLLSCFTGLQALLEADGSQGAMLVANDHEEVGSMSAAGAQGPLLRSVLERLSGDANEYAGLIERSMMISADNAHGLHPNYADRHDENHGPLLNAGPVIKVNASQRYATNSETSGLFRQLAAAEDVPVQTFVVRSDMGCGSTIGPITAGVTGVRTLDIGVPTFAMHSIRELAGSRDAWNLSKILRRYYNHAGSLRAQ